MASWHEMSRLMVALAALVAATCLVSVRSAGAQSLVLGQRVELPAVDGRIDHMDIDIDGNRLFVAALGAGSVEVVDLRAGKRIARIQPLHEPQGVAYLAGAHRLFVASGAVGDAQAFAEGKTPAVARAEGLDDADNVRVDRAAGQLVVGSATVSKSDTARYLAAGANAFLPKPIDVRQLLQRIGELLKVDWTFARPSEAPDSTAALIPPPQPTLQALARLARSGEMRALREAANQLSTLGNQYKPFANRLVHLAERFESLAITQLIQQFLEP